MLRVLPRKPQPTEDQLPRLPDDNLEELNKMDDDEKRQKTIEYARVLVQRTMDKMQRQKLEHNGMPYVRVRVQPVYTGV